MATASDYADVAESLYVAYFGAPHDISGLINFENALAAADTTGTATTLDGLQAACSANTAIATLIDSFGTSAASIALYGEVTTESSAQSFVNAIFENGFSRPSSDAGLMFWINALLTSGVSPGSVALQIAASAGGADAATLATKVDAYSLLIEEIEAACYCRGTRILTASGEVAVEDLAIGDLVVTLSGALRPVRWIGRRGYNGRFVAGNRDILPICIKPDAIMTGVPARELWISPEHSLSIDDVLVQAKHLINGVTVVQATTVSEVEYFHIELDSHNVIYADGMPAETFVDCDNRLIFSNGAEYGTLYPDDERPRWCFCAPRLEWGSPQLVEIRQWMFARAQSFAGFADDPELHLLVDGIAIAPIEASGTSYRFEVPSQHGSVWLRSPAHIPAEREPASLDTRRLGVPVAEIVLASGDQSLKVRHWNPLLRQGFHAAERAHRWTDGMARIPDEMLRAFPGALTIIVTIVEDGHLSRRAQHRSVA